MTMLRLLSVIAFCAGLFCLAQSNAQVPLTGAGPSGSIAVSCSFSTINFTTGSLGTASLSRGSSATYINVSGVLTTASTNVARFNYDANYPRGNAAPSLTGPFLLVEPAATNILLQSNAFSTSPWFTPTSSVLVSGVFTSPDGTANGWSVTPGTGFGGVDQSLALSNVAYAMSMWGETRTGVPAFHLLFNNIDQATNALTATLTRVFVTGTANAGASVTAAAYLNTTGAIVAGIYGGQLETGSAPTSYIVTTTTSATRSADVVTFTQPAGCGHNTYTFDDNSTQVVSQAAGSATVPTNLTRPNIKSIAGST